MEALDKYSVGVPSVLWLPWTPQLLNCMVQYEGNVILNLLCQVGRMFPQAVYFPVRILYLTLRTASARKTTTAQVRRQHCFCFAVSNVEIAVQVTLAKQGNAEVVSSKFYRTIRKKTFV